MTPSQYGQYSLFLSWDSVISIFATLNLSYQVFNNGLVRYPRDRDGYTSSMLGLSNVCTAIVYVLYLLFHEWVNAASGLNMTLFSLMFIQYFFNQALALWTVKERFFYRYKAVTIVTMASAFASSLLSVLAVLATDEKVLARVASLVSVNAVFGLGAYVLVIKTGRKPFCAEYWKYILPLNLPLIPHYLSMTALGSVDRILIGRICGPEFTALYSIAFSVAAILQLLLSAINSSFIPWFYQKMSDGDYKRIVSISSSLLLMVGLLSLLPALFGPEVMALLGPKVYLEGVVVMPPISVGVFFIFLYTMFSNYELYYNNSKIIMWASLFAATFSISLNLILLPILGFAVSGYVSLLSYVLLSLLHYWGMWITSRKGPNRPIPFQARSILVMSLTLLLLALGLGVTYRSTPVRYSMIAVLIGIMIYKRDTLFGSIRNMRKGLD